MGKRPSLNPDLFTRAERARMEATMLAGQLTALRELRMLERDFRAITRNLATTIEAVEITATPDGLRRLLDHASDLLGSGGGADLPTPK